jgi:hypothetical protein
MDSWADILDAVILPKVRDPRLVTIRRGGSLTDADHHLLALWAASCAEHVLHLFEQEQPADPRPREAIEAARAWVRGAATMMHTRALGGHAMGAARPLQGPARFAARAAGQAACVAHVPEHDLGAAAYAIRAVRAGAPAGTSIEAGRLERNWQRRHLPEQIRVLVLDDQSRRDEICWSVFTS